MIDKSGKSNQQSDDEMSTACQWQHADDVRQLVDDGGANDDDDEDGGEDDGGDANDYGAAGDVNEDSDDDDGDDFDADDDNDDDFDADDVNDDGGDADDEDGGRANIISRQRLAERGLSTGWKTTQPWVQKQYKNAKQVMERKKITKRSCFICKQNKQINEPNGFAWLDITWQWD